MHWIRAHSGQPAVVDLRLAKNKYCNQFIWFLSFLSHDPEFQPEFLKKFSILDWAYSSSSIFFFNGCGYNCPQSFLNDGLFEIFSALFKIACGQMWHGFFQYILQYNSEGKKSSVSCLFWAGLSLFPPPSSSMQGVVTIVQELSQTVDLLKFSMHRSRLLVDKCCMASFTKFCKTILRRKCPL